MMKNLLEYIDSKESEMLEFLESLVNIDSGSYDKAGVDRVGDVLAERLADLEFDVQRNPQKELGDHVIGSKPGTGNQRVLFIGHMDTVFSRRHCPKTTVSYRGRPRIRTGCDGHEGWNYLPDLCPGSAKKRST